VTRTIHGPVAARATDRPDALAVTLGDEELSYGELDRLSDAIAARLLQEGARPDDRVCLFVSKSPLAVAAMLGCLRAGCVYVPIDLASPAARLGLIVEAADPAFALVAADARAILDQIIALGAVPAGAAVISLAAIEPGAEPAPVERRASDAAHILFTSGSTGTPKGVVITHANVVAFLEWAIAYFRIEAGDRLSGHAPFHFDLSTFDIYSALWTGAELHLVPPSANLLPRDLAAFIERRQLTQWFSVPTVFAYMDKLDAVPESGFTSLQRILWCGDVLPTPVLRAWMRRHPGATFTNLYGPTEATIASSYHTLEEMPESDTSPVPIGRPCDGEELLVLDAELVPVPAGETGDLYIGGTGLSPGYWRDDEKTDHAFLADPRGGAGRIYRTGDLARLEDDGLVYFVGRSDSQIKSRGHRIELGEVEVAVNSLDAVREVAVVAVDTGDFDAKAICCAWAPTDDAPEGERLRSELQPILPAYMLPSRWLRLDNLPKNANGKIDRRRVRELFEQRVEAVAHLGLPPGTRPA
jgi:amino acid adenylation domain-containing protein